MLHEIQNETVPAAPVKSRGHFISVISELKIKLHAILNLLLADRFIGSLQLIREKRSRPGNGRYGPDGSTATGKKI